MTTLRSLLKPVESNGTALAMGCPGWKVYEMPTYPHSPSGELLRRSRVKWGLTLRTAADVLGVTPSELSGLEMGRLTIEDWDAVFDRLYEARTTGRTG